MWFYHLTFCFVNPFALSSHPTTARFRYFCQVGSEGFVRIFRPFGIYTLISLGLLGKICAQTGLPEPARPLVLTEAISTPGVQGRFDHFGFDGKNQLFVAALGNNSVEVIDISARLRARSIPDIPNPQGIAYSPDSKKIFVASSKGKL
jgi:DNA-binding beta-propeller fold protein YncE